MLPNKTALCPGKSEQYTEIEKWARIAEALYEMRVRAEAEERRALLRLFIRQIGSKSALAARLFARGFRATATRFRQPHTRVAATITVSPVMTEATLMGGF